VGLKKLKAVSDVALDRREIVNSQDPTGVRPCYLHADSGIETHVFLVFTPIALALSPSAALLIGSQRMSDAMSGSRISILGE
jgi:hypothetical protein